MGGPRGNLLGSNGIVARGVFAASVGFFSVNAGCTGQSEVLAYREVPLDEVVVVDGKSLESGAIRVEPLLRSFRPLPQWMTAADNPLDEAKISLGKTLFEDERFSASGEISCATCHPLDAYGVDGHPVAIGHKGKLGKRNTPTVFNAAGQIGQHWDGIALTVEEQAKIPFFKPSGMAMPDIDAVMKIISADAHYPAAFQNAFPSERNTAISFENVARAIGAFERTLVTPSRWDRFLLGEESALSDKEKAGLSTFIEVGCPVCHKGTYVGGDRYRKLGSLVPWPSTVDTGRHRVTQIESDWMVFKVASLRNVERTGPYFHDGSVARLDDAVRAMAHHQLGRTLADEQVNAIVAWLGALTGALARN